MKGIVNALAIALGIASTAYVPPLLAQASPKTRQRAMVDLVLANTRPLEYARGNRLPLYLWPLHGLGCEDPAEAEGLLRQLDARGLAVITAWDPQQRARTLKEGLQLGRFQQQLGMPIVINATACLNSFCNGEAKTAHIDDDGKPFFDYSFAPDRPMGCPFALEFRHPAIRGQLEPFLDAYQQARLSVNLIFVDWEVDGPIEWNDAWAHSKRCRRCREHVPNIEDFAAFQKALRTVRCRMQRECYAAPVLKRFPKAMVGNYAVYPNDGYRYWYDYFEKETPKAPFKADQRAKYRPWFQEFPLTGYTVAMPVVYTWYATHGWYDFPDSDYRWFYNLLLVASNAGKSRSTDAPSVPFVHWHTTTPPKNADPSVKQFSATKYQELLWHMLMRGHDSLFLWCTHEEAAEEIRFLHEVYAASLEYKQFFERGKPVTFDVPHEQAPVLSGLRLGNRVLVRRTDFDDRASAVALTIDGKPLLVPKSGGRCQLLRLD